MGNKSFEGIIINIVNDEGYSNVLLLRRVIATALGERRGIEFLRLTQLLLDMENDLEFYEENYIEE